jgi:hypothetical protein
MRIHLSALGWVDDAPQGHRLRWHYPVLEVVAGGYLGLPTRILVERAPLDRQHMYGHAQASAQYPLLWWEPIPDVNVFGFVPPHEHVLASPVQAITFDYHGAPARIVIRDSARDAVVFDRLVNDGDNVYAEAALIDSVLLYTTWANLTNIQVLDLFKSHGLAFEPIAEIAVAATYAQALATIAPRYDQATTIGTTEWTELQDAIAAANASSPATEIDGRPTPWQSVQIVLGLRWEFALLGGFAFFDGPRKSACALDRLHETILKAPPATFMAYRVRDMDGPAGHSNLALCAPWPAPALVAPNAPSYVNPEVRLREGKSSIVDSGVLATHASLAQFTPIAGFDGDYTVRTTQQWQQNDPRALGVEMDEQVSPSPATGAAGKRLTFMSRSRRLDDPPLAGSVARVFDVSFVDVTLRSRARAIDAWDRASGFSPWSPVTPLILRHEPKAPPLESAGYRSGSAHLMRAVGRPGVADWAPDPIVSQSGGQVYVYRRTSNPRTATVNVSGPLAIAPGYYRVGVSGASGLSDFVGGTLSAGAFSDTIVAATASTVDITIPHNGSPVTLFSAGEGRLAQDPLAEALWTHVATFSAAGLPEEIVFADPLPPPTGLAVEYYCTRVAFLGRLGPLGNVVGAIRTPEVPMVPPPFTVVALGLDFYRRTMIKLRFTTPPGAGRYSIWWADGGVAAAQFPRRGSAGTYGAQEPAGGDTLYDVLPLPIPAHVDRTITIGVQQVLGGGVQGDFVVAPIVLPALSP